MTISKKAKLVVALIHNEDQKRYQHIRPMLDQLKEKLTLKYDVEIFEVLKEPEIIPHNIFMTLFTKYLYWKIYREWVGYKGYKKRNIFADLSILIWCLVRTYLNRSYESRRCVIESYVNDKHIRAWTQFLDKKADFLICFEDDAVFKPTSISKFEKLLSQIKINLINKPVYLDFAGGNSFEILKIDRLEIKKDKLGKYYRKPVTNTACTYLINYKTASIFLEILLRCPWLRLISADWLLNKLFILTAQKYKYYCYHAYPHIFDHGSVKGNYTSLYNDL